MKKFLITILCLALMVSAIGCGEKANTQKNESTSSKDYVYKVNPLELAQEGSGSFRLIKNEEVIYAYNYNYSGENTCIDLYQLDTNGAVMGTCQIELEMNSGMNSLTADKEGNLYGIQSHYPVEPDESGNYQETFTLEKYDKEGNRIFQMELNSLPELSPKEDEYFYTDGLMLYKDFLYLKVMDQYVKFDMDGNLIEVLTSGKGINYDRLTLYPLENGKVAAVSYEDNGVGAAFLNLEEGTISEKNKLPGASYEYYIYAGIGYDLFLVNNYGVYGYNIGDDEKTPLMDYIDSDLGIYMISNLVPVSEKAFIGVYDDMETSETSIGYFTKVEPEQVKEKETLVLACIGMDWELRTAVLKFNKSNENYRISIKDYFSLYATDDNYMAGINRLNTDIISGHIPDIILVNSGMPFESYIAKGIIEDLMPYMEKDADFSPEDFMPNILEAFSVDGKLYRLVPSYMIQTIVAKTSDVGERKGWTLEDVNQLMASHEGTQFLAHMTRSAMLEHCMTMTGNQFVDWERGICNFESESFIKLLEFLKPFPEELDDEIFTDEYWMHYEGMWRAGKVLAQITTISDFQSYNYMEKGTFGEKITMLGFPSQNEGGSVILPNMQLAMSAKSEHKDAVWEFMRYFLTDEYQSEITFGWPLSIEKLNALGEEAMKVPTYTDENGNEVEAFDYYYIDDMEIIIEPFTKEEVEALKEELYSFTNVYYYNEDLLQIVQEETAPFFNGQKSAEEVAKIVQSRAQLYVNENR